MQVYVLFFMPYGCPAHDVEIFGVFSTEEKCLKAKEAYLDEGYNADELVYSEKQLDLLYIN